jgi:hypothetical protein
VDKPPDGAYTSFSEIRSPSNLQRGKSHEQDRPDCRRRSRYFAGQTYYGVEAEALVGEEWVNTEALEDGAEIEAVRLFDCDGERGRTCRTVAQVEAERVKWVKWIEMLAPVNNDDDAE